MKLSATQHVIAVDSYYILPLYEKSLFIFSYNLTTPKDLDVGIYREFKNSLPKCSHKLDLSTA